LALNDEFELVFMGFNPSLLHSLGLYMESVVISIKRGLRQVVIINAQDILIFLIGLSLVKE
jgi:hypothetical protein